MAVLYDTLTNTWETSIRHTLKSIIMKFYFPIAAILTLLSVYLFSWHLLPNLLLGFSNVVLIISIMFYSGNNDFPFSVPQNTNTKGGNLMKNLFRMLLMAIGGLVHYLIFSFPVVILICLTLSAIANWLLMDSIKKISLGKIRTSADS